MWSRSNSRSWVASVLLVGATFAVSAQAALSGIGESKVQFRAVGPAGLTIDGEGSSLSVVETDGLIAIEAPLTDLKTGIGLRDDHLKKALDTSKFPKAKLVVERSKLSLPEDNKELEASATAQLTLHGVTKPTKVSYKVQRTGSDYHVSGRTEVDITDFGIEVPCYLGVCVDKNVKIKVKFKAREK